MLLFSLDQSLCSVTLLTDGSLKNGEFHGFSFCEDDDDSKDTFIFVVPSHDLSLLSPLHVPDLLPDPFHLFQVVFNAGLGVCHLCQKDLEGGKDMFLFTTYIYIRKHIFVDHNNQ